MTLVGRRVCVVKTGLNEVGGVTPSQPHAADCTSCHARPLRPASCVSAGSRTVRQYAEGLNELEIKVEEATNSEKWGPHGSLMQGVAFYLL